MEQAIGAACIMLWSMHETRRGAEVNTLLRIRLLIFIGHQKSFLCSNQCGVGWKMLRFVFCATVVEVNLSPSRYP